jgi:adenylate cyclase
MLRFQEPNSTTTMSIKKESGTADSDTPRSSVLKSAFAAVFGNPRLSPMEQRLFNAMTLINGVINIIGAPSLMHLPNGARLFAVQMVTGTLFLALYGMSRFRNNYRVLYWPFMILICVFLWISTTLNSGTLGGTHYYVVTAAVIGIILSASTRRAIASLALFACLAASLVLFERINPERIAFHMDSGIDWVPVITNVMRSSDVSGNYVFNIVLVGALVIILVSTLEKEREKSDRLLLNILPDTIADELKRFAAVEPRDFSSATVLFTDIKGFTSYSEKTSPKELVQDLDACFSAFDDVVTETGIEKIKTIGDAYMAVGGIPVPNANHAPITVLAALRIRCAMEAINQKRTAQGKAEWQIRIGLHSGHLSAGVIGKHKFAYDVWGDAVNVASRMESAGYPGEINISEDLFNLVSAYFDCEPRGSLPIKNHGEVNMFFVKRIKSAYSTDKDGRIPNEDFPS